MISSSHLAQYLWIAQPILQLVLVATMWRRKLHKQFPTFFAYTLVQIINFGVTFPVRSYYEWYFWLFWIGSGVNALLSFKVIHEVFLNVFRPYHTLKDLGTVLFKWAGAVMLLVSVVVAFSRSTDRFDPVARAVTTMQGSIRLIQFGLILFLLLFSRFLGVSRRQQSFGIALGFGALAGAELILLALMPGRFIHLSTFNLVNTVAYDVAIMIWMSYAFARGLTRQTIANHFQTDRWEHSLADIQHPAGSESLIPMFENMVERAFSRSDVSEGSGLAARAAAAGSQTRK